VSRWKTTFVLWPRWLVHFEEPTPASRIMRRIGWVWLQRAYLTNNNNHGWIAFVGDQTEANLKKHCTRCGQEVK